jgi:hypothetical protein
LGSQQEQRFTPLHLGRQLCLSSALDIVLVFAKTLKKRHMCDEKSTIQKENRLSRRPAEELVQQATAWEE